MEKIKIFYRNWLESNPPKPIKLKIPGWGGDSHGHSNGDKPQPWHCIPFTEGSTYGLELLYPFDTECCVELIDGKVKIHGDFTEENKKCPSIPLPPFSTFAPGHFGMSSGLDIEVPENYVLRLEPHPRFYVDTTNTVPCCITGHLQTNWWPKIFFVVFKNPIPGQTLIFRKGEPYGQILILPKKVSYEIQEMSPEEKAKRNQVDAKIEKYYKKFVKNDWIDNEGHNFNDTYKQLSSLKGNLSDVERFLDQFAEENKKKKIKCKLVKKKNHETI